MPNGLSLDTMILLRLPCLIECSSAISRTAMFCRDFAMNFVRSYGIVIAAETLVPLCLDVLCYYLCLRNDHAFQSGTKIFFYLRLSIRHSSTIFIIDFCCFVMSIHLLQLMLTNNFCRLLVLHIRSLMLM